MPARLTIHFASVPARELALPDGREAVVGRGAGCQVVIEDDRVSRRHAALSPGPAGWTLRDLGSKNGTLVDGVPVGVGAAGNAGDTGDTALPRQAWLSFGGVLARFEAAPEVPESLEETRRRRMTSAFEARRELDPALGLPRLLDRVVSSMLSLTGA